jgi:nitrate reductase gamma subunit
MRNQPFFVFGAFIFHIMLILVPIFFSAHIFLWEEAFGISLLSFPDILSDIMTLALIGSGLFLLLRRIIRTEVRILTGVWDYVLLLLTIFPFITGFLAFHQFGPYKTMVLLHIISGEILLIIIPFSKLAHVILFFFTRTFIGFEMGTRRGARSW